MSKKDIKLTDDKVRELSASWWDTLTIRNKWDLFFKYNPMIANASSNIGLRLSDIEKSHIDEIWKSENINGNYSFNQGDKVKIETEDFGTIYGEFHRYGASASCAIIFVDGVMRFVDEKSLKPVTFP